MKVYFLVLLLLAIQLSSSLQKSHNSKFVSPCQNGTVPFPGLVLGSKVWRYNCVPESKAYEDAVAFLANNLPSFDAPNKCTLGLEDCQEGSPNDGIANIGVNISLSVKNLYRWAADVPQDLFHEYVIPFGNVNEARSHWRPLLLEGVQKVLNKSGKDLSTLTVTEVVMIVNEGLWTAFNKTIVFKSSQTPLIYDPMSVLGFGYASCTGVSIFLIDALRSIGIPSRIAGTPAWNNVTSNGNHNWIEVFTSVEKGWQFIEASPAGSNETFDNPCDKWFCNKNKFANGTQVFAARFDQSSSVRYPMAWDFNNTQIPGVDRSDYYQQACTACP